MVCSSQSNQEIGCLCIMIGSPCRRLAYYAGIGVLCIRPSSFMAICPYETFSWLFRKFQFRALLHIYYWYHLINVHLYFTRGSLNVIQMQFSSRFWHLWPFVPMKHFLSFLGNFNWAHFYIFKIGII